MVHLVDDTNFEEEVLNSDLPVVVDFYATWCGPCRTMTPVIEKVSSEETGVKFVKIDVDASPKTANKYGIRSIPTFALFKNGHSVSNKVGVLTESALLELAKS